MDLQGEDVDAAMDYWINGLANATGDLRRTGRSNYEIGHGLRVTYPFHGLCVALACPRGSLPSLVISRFLCLQSGVHNLSYCPHLLFFPLPRHNLEPYRRTIVDFWIILAFFYQQRKGESKLTPSENGLTSFPILPIDVIQWLIVIIECVD